jgi:hypothetical protein
MTTRARKQVVCVCASFKCKDKKYTDSAGQECSGNLVHPLTRDRHIKGDIALCREGTAEQSSEEEMVRRCALHMPCIFSHRQMQPIPVRLPASTPLVGHRARSPSPVSSAATTEPDDTNTESESAPFKPLHCLFISCRHGHCATISSCSDLDPCSVAACSMRTQPHPRLENIEACIHNRPIRNLLWPNVCAQPQQRISPVADQQCSDCSCGT